MHMSNAMWVVFDFISSSVFLFVLLNMCIDAIYTFNVSLLSRNVEKLCVSI